MVYSISLKYYFFLNSLSMGLLVNTGPIVWRGPLVMSAVQRLLRGAVWGPLDILIVDTPPGTGDVHLSLSQNIPISGVLLVSSPQTAALEVTKRGAEMYKTLKVPLIGLVENMSHVICDNCNHKIELSNNRTEEFAEILNVDVLGRIPIEKEVMQCCDSGTPLCLKFPESKFADSYRRIGEKIVEFLNKVDEKYLFFIFLQFLHFLCSLVERLFLFLL